MRKVCLSALGVKVEGQNIYSLIKDEEGNTLRIVRLATDLEDMDEVVRLKGSKGFLLKVMKKQLLASIDNSLVLIDEEGDQKVVLRANGVENFFWHISESDEGYIFVQEYGKSPTGIYVSEDLRRWKKIITNVELDRHSRHFHYISWDPYRRWLIATIGDDCLTRVVHSEDSGRSWKPLYKGAWQFIPVVPLKDKIVFGMDSGIVKGGVGIFYPGIQRWKFRFFRWQDEKVSFAHISDLKLTNNGLWIAAFGNPQAIAVSKDLHTWYPIYVDRYDANFNFHISIEELENTIICSTGNHLIALDKDELHETILNGEPVALPYRAYHERLIGLGFLLKRKLGK